MSAQEPSRSSVFENRSQVRGLVALLLGVLLLIWAANAVAATDAVSGPSPSPETCPSPDPTAPPSPFPLATQLCPSPPPSSEPAITAAPEMPGEVIIEAGDLWFDPQVVAIPSVGETTLTLIDRGFITHNLTVDELGLLLVTPAGRSASVTLTDPAPGEYRFYCSISGHAQAGMEGALVVE